MSLRQLRQLQSFCTVLCQAGMLKYGDSAHNRQLGRVGKRVQWTKLTQHEICHLIIKKIIPKDQSCSWVEAVADGRPQKRNFFCSHNWGECFRDFMVSIEAHAKEKGIAMETTYWICVYANNQHSVELGLTLSESPFYSALKGSRATLLLLDKTAEALLRLWCVFELHATLVKEKQALELWTPLGKVGSGLVSSGPVIQALNRIDTCCAQASDPVDQRQILNHIAEVNETEGIKILEGNAKELDEDKHQRGKYEEKLIEAHKSKFEALNKEIKNSVKNALDPEQQKSIALEPSSEEHLEEPPTLDSPLKRGPFELTHKQRFLVNDGCKRGITLQQLRNFHQKMKCDFEKNPESHKVDGKGPWTYDTADIYAVQKLYLDKATKEAGCSLMELISDAEQRPEYHVIYGSKITFKDFMAALEWHAEARQLPDSAVYFIVPFMLDPDDANRPEETKFTRRRPCTRDVLEKHAIGVVMLVDNEASVLKRCIPAWEAHCGISLGLCFDMAAASGALATTKPFSNNAWEFGEFDADIARKALKFDVAKTTGNDIEKFLGEIAFDDALPKGAQIPTSEENYSFMRLNMRFRQKVAGPVLREAGFTGEIEMIEEVLMACPNMSLGIESLRGTLGETAVHTAAASGHVEVIKLLMILKATAEPLDAVGSTPLHYAAMAGQTETAKLLLELGADPEARNFDTETPLRVAHLNPCYFIPIDTCGVAKELEKAAQEAKEMHSALFARVESKKPAVLHNKVSVLRVENWKLRQKVAALSKSEAKLADLQHKLTESEGKLAASETERQRLQAENNALRGGLRLPQRDVDSSSVPVRASTAPSPNLARDKVFEVFVNKNMRFSQLHDLLQEISGRGDAECQKLIDAARDDLGYDESDAEINCEQFLQWLGSAPPTGMIARRR